MNRERLTSFPILDGLIALTIILAVLALFYRTPQTILSALFFAGLLLVTLGAIVASGTSRYTTATVGGGYGAVDYAKTLTETRAREWNSGVRMMIIGGMILAAFGVALLLRVGG